MATSKIQGKNLEYQDRDFNLLRGLFECRVMTTAHVAALFFEGKIDAAIKRLQKLKSAGLIGERPRHAFEPSILLLTSKGLALLQSQGILDDYPPFALPVLARRARVSALTIHHELEVMNVKTAFHAAIKHVPSTTIAEFSTWPLLNEFKAYRPGHTGAEILVKPDSFIRILETEANGDKFERAFFLEVDRSTETLDVLIDRAGCYFNFYKSGGFAIRNGADRADYKEFPFRVLMVFKTAERRNNTAERLLQNVPPILTQVYLSTITEATEDPLGPIWIRPLDYREAIKSTQFDVDRQREKWGYKRQKEREIMVEQKIRKMSLLTN